METNNAKAKSNYSFKVNQITREDIYRITKEAQEDGYDFVSINSGKGIVNLVSQRYLNRLKDVGFNLAYTSYLFNGLFSWNVLTVKKIDPAGLHSALLRAEEKKSQKKNVTVTVTRFR
jgi:uncharacterized radical SAM superfamily Fe-S cluster-containing enzyme